MPGAASTNETSALTGILLTSRTGSQLRSASYDGQTR